MNCIVFEMATVFEMALGQARSTDPLICHCFQVTASAVRGAIDDGGAERVEEVSRLTAAGSGCGSCQCRIQRLLAGLPAECGPCALCPGCGTIRTLCECHVA
ncbi:MAG: (2Fe-2S)-binding protein [Verrucomicrobiota bacterium]|nr:(2Fe-2S)-binding protein [Verrucomicrobiota bacterium]